jgi:hypothetical protein
MQRISGYCFSIICTFFFLFHASGQEGRIKGIRIGYDISRIALLYLEPERKAFEVSADFEVKLNYYLTVEYGQQQVDLNKPIYHYASDGNYFRVGFDYNYARNKKNVSQYEMVFGGIRFGHSGYRQDASLLVLPENYWGTGTVGPLPLENLTANWFEITVGIRGEIFKNFFIGWSFRGKIMLWQKKDVNMNAYNIPGFGAGNKKSNLGFNYYVYYRIPLYKTRK